MLNTRRSQVLDLVAETYISSAKPVPSTPIAETLGVSSATVRNEFCALEHEGYLVQPHTSAGRIPTTRGFEAYARKFIPHSTMTGNQQQWVLEHIQGRHGDSLFQQIANVTAHLSGYAVVVSLPADDSLHALEIHLSALSSNRILAVVVLENGLTRQIVIELDPSPSKDTLRDAESSLRQLTLPVGELPTALNAIAKRVDQDLARTLVALASAWPQISPTRFFSQGLSNVLAEPESADPVFIRRVVEYVEQPALVASDAELHIMLDETVANVVSQLQLGSSLGTLVLLGPARMRYRDSLRVADGVTKTLAGRFADTSLN